MNRFVLVLILPICLSAADRLAWAAGQPAKPAAPAIAGPATRADEQIILATGSQWRAYGMSGPGQFAAEFAGPGSARRIDLDEILGKVPQTSPPPANWAAPDAGPAVSFWTRSPGPVDVLPRGCKTLYLRGLFGVTDPAKVRRLTLSVAYRGGIVVYLNGREVARKDLPAGPLTPDTQARPFPVEAYLDSAGEAHEQYFIDKAIFNGDKDLAARVATRNRALGPLDLPTDGLRQGPNVLAIEIHRSGYRPEVAKWAKYGAGEWAHLQCTSLRLFAAGGGIQANVDRPAQVQVWNRDVHDVFSTDDYGDPNEPLGPIRMVGPRNGCCSGQVVVGSPKAALDHLRATCSELVGQDGSPKGRIPADQVQVFYPGLTTIEYSIRLDGIDMPKWQLAAAFGALLNHPPDTIAVTAMKGEAKERAALGLPAAFVPAAVQPVWITVRIPKDAAPGLYRGTLEISSAGNALAGIGKVPVELEVVDFASPAPKDAVTTMALNQSPETLALHYGVELWSERHWQLMDKSYQLLGQARNNLLIIPLVCRTQYGNDDCYLPWIRQGDGSYQFDFTVHDRLIELARKNFDLRVISYQVYLSHDWNKVGPDKPTFVTVVDKASGKRERMKLPAYGSAESVKLFKPLVEQIKQHLAKLGIENEKGTRIVLGVCQDGGVDKTVVEFFKGVWPDVNWHYGSHNRPSAYGLNKMFGYSEYLYVQPIPPPATAHRYGWKYTPLTVMSQRVYGVKQFPMAVRTLAERGLVRGDNGAGRMCLDYWQVLADERGQKLWLYDRWPDSACDQRAPCLRCLAQPGPDGPVPSTKFAVLREGLQEAEARIVLERALVDKKITGPQAEKVQALLDRRVEELRAFDYLWGNGTLEDVRTGYGAGWQASSAELLAAAAEVVNAAGGK